MLILYHIIFLNEKSLPSLTTTMIPSMIWAYLFAAVRLQFTLV